MAKPTAAEIATWTTPAHVFTGIEDSANATNSATCSALTRCTYCRDTKYSEDSEYLTKSNGAKMCNNSHDLTQCKFLKNCYHCKDCHGAGEGPSYRSQRLYLCEGCVECNHCIGMKGANGVSYMICGTRVQQAEFERIWGIIEPTLLAEAAAVT
jgi:hypothetical protein